MKHLKIYVFKFIPFFILCISMVSCSGNDKALTQENNGNNKEKITNVETSTVKKTNFEDIVSLTGTAESLQRVTVSSEESGKITFLNCDEGRRVNKGDILVKQDIELLALEKQAAESNYSLAETNYQRIKKLFDKGSTSSQEMQSATVNRDVAKTQLDLVKL